MLSRPILLAIVLTDISYRNESEDEDTVIATRQKQSEGPLTKMILIRVGEAQETQTIPVHRKFLCKMSRYFKSAFKDDPERSSFEFPEQEPEIFERAMNWIYGEGFDTAKSDGADWLSTQASQDTQDTNEPASLLVVEYGSGYREVVSPEPSTKVVDLASGSDFSDDEQEEHVPGDASNETEPPTPLDTMILSKLYALAEFLKMDKLCNELIELLGQRLGYDKKTPDQALIYAFKRCGADSPLRKLLIDFTARSAPIVDVLQDPTFDATPELWRAMVKELTAVRGADVLRPGEWAQYFDSTLGEYRVRN